MFFIYTTILCIYLLIRTIFLLSAPLYIKCTLAILIIIGANLHFISKQISGYMVANYPKTILYSWEFLFTFCMFLFLTTLTLDIIRLISLFPVSFFKTINIFLLSNKVIIASILLSTIFAIYGLYQGNKVPDIKKTIIHIDKWPPSLDGFKIVQLTDLHISNLLTKEWLSRVVEKTNKEKPDLIVITGDLTDGMPKDYKNNIIPLKNLQAEYGVYGSQGNHEYYYDFEGWNNEYRKNNVKMLNNEHVLIGYSDKFVLAGVTDPAASRFGKEPNNIEKALKNHNNSLPVILMDHRPSNAFENSAFNVDLQLSGHTHGGMMPLLAQIVKKANNGLSSGYYLIGDLQLYLSNGTGIWNGFPIRLGYNSEITVLEIYSKKE